MADIDTPMMAPVSARTAGSLGVRPVRSATTAVNGSSVLASWSSARARNSGTAMMSVVALALARELVCGQAPEHRAEGAPECGEWTQLRGLGAEVGDQERVVAVVQDHVLFGREVAEERRLGNLSLRGDLIHGGGVIALALEQVQRRRLDRGPGPCLLALA